MADPMPTLTHIRRRIVAWSGAAAATLIATSIALAYMPQRWQVIALVPAAVVCSVATRWQGMEWGYIARLRDEPEPNGGKPLITPDAE